MSNVYLNTGIYVKKTLLDWMAYGKTSIWSYTTGNQSCLFILKMCFLYSLPCTINASSWLKSAVVNRMLICHKTPFVFTFSYEESECAICQRKSAGILDFQKFNKFGAHFSVKYYKSYTCRYKQGYTFTNRKLENYFEYRGNSIVIQIRL